MHFWSPSKPLGRSYFALFGVALVLFKYALDRMLMQFATGKMFVPWDYLFGGWFFGTAAHQRLTGPTVDSALLIFCATALPFVIVGVVLTLRRLRSAALSPLFVLLFFVPFINLLFFVVLCVLPGVGAEPASGMEREPGGLRRILPRTDFGAAYATVLLVVPINTLFTLVATNWLKNYGWGIFAGVPFELGLVSALLFCSRAQRSLLHCLVVGLLAGLLLAGAIFLVALEGAMCLMMALPLAIPIVMLGSVVGWAIMRRPAANRSATSTLSSLVLALPVLLGIERAVEVEPPTWEVRSEVVIDAPPEVVWKHVVTFADIGEPKEWYFRSGIAYPTHAEIDGQGVGAVRRCVFTTGAFVEPITVWDEPHRLAFSVREHPPAMHEWSIWPDLHPAHVDDYLRSRRGEFVLEELPGGRTRLAGSTWYTHKIWPALYWKQWSDWLIHRIHMRVLTHIKIECENDGTRSAPR